MIIIVKEAGSAFEITPLLAKLDADIHVMDAQPKLTFPAFSDDDVLTIVLWHKKALLDCRELLNQPKRQKRILVILEPELGSNSVSARIAGADCCLVGPVDEKTLFQAIANEHAASRRWFKGQSLIAAGTVIGDRYTLNSLLGVGLRSSVFLAYDQRLDKAVTIKLVRKMLGGNEELVSDFLAEGSGRIDCKSPFLNDLIDCGVCNGSPYLVYNTGELKNLYRMLRENKFTEKMISHLALSLINALIALKQAKHLHCNLKPENILSDGENFYLSDFGLLHPVERPLDSFGFPYWSEAAFAAPEYFNANCDITGAGDIYSLGVLLFTVVTRQNPFYGYLLEDVARRQEQELINFDAKNVYYGEDIGVSLRSVIQSMVLVKSAHRPRLAELKVIFFQMQTLSSGSYPREPVSYFLKPDAALPPPEAIPEVVKTTGVLPSSTEIPVYRPFWRRRRLYYFLVPLLLVLLGYFWGKGRTIPEFRQGDLELFTCYSGHTYADRTLNYRTIRCKRCGDLTSPSYTCLRCKKVFGLSLWPQREMTEEECAAFEKKRMQCPFCKSGDIIKSKLPK